ncbi:SDR family NAD(P)-dependent oxidoreductase [Sphingosinicella soli]|uniref:NAD(P)-dependent dehydrogenase (Short-subunit alcohol dehydrogenase family) n=1 Tax=Sphingosinicella soli TaxID=333708 RepID=A0A7W7F6W4_9SPHN|nr:SDR family oxidoreductase [Sphingosinicella soli]MBB4632002.1 NAD(P)-dependent dehydrogenase (short-subunit alcohol dehydrogenase family) [Sphingosinicella soli]
MNDKVVLIVGGARGLGEATARKFAKNGAKLMLVDILGQELDALATDLRAGGADCRSITSDIGIRENCFAIVDETVKLFGRLDILCNVAAIVRFGHTIEVSADEWQKVVAVNLSGPFHLCQAAIPHLLSAHGNIVNVVSQAAMKGLAYIAPYSASKGGLLQLTRSMAAEYLKHPIRVNAVAPGTMSTNIADGLQWPEGVDGDLLQRHLGVRGPDTTAAVANAIYFLASDEAESIHGVCLPVDGGLGAT